MQRVGLGRFELPAYRYLLPGLGNFSFAFLQKPLGLVRKRTLSIAPAVKNSRRDRLSYKPRELGRQLGENKFKTIPNTGKLPR